LDRNGLTRVVLLACLVLSLGASVDLGRRLGSERSELRARLVVAEAAISRCDTLEAANALLAGRADSMELWHDRALSLGTRLQADSISRVYPDYYLIIDTGQNRFYLMFGNLLVRSGYCGTGKGWTSNDLGNAWDFSTPRGLRHVVEHGENPYWFRPDWYWLEQNMRPPAPDQVIAVPESLSYQQQVAWFNDSLTPRQRVYVRQVPGVLGGYKIDLGGGVLLHYGVGRGTNVSHGCIRLSPGDIEVLYRTLPIGAPVLIY